MEQLAQRLIDALQAAAMKVVGISRRDKREPGRIEKERLDLALSKVFNAVFKRQRARVVARLEKEFPERKSWDLDPDMFEWEDDELEELRKALAEAYKRGVKLFASDLPDGLDFDFTLTNERAADIAKTYAYDLINRKKGGITATTRELLQQAVGRFVDTPGMTVGDVVNSLWMFDERRAQTIAVTEITRAYSEAAQEAARDLKEKYPDVRVTKTWFTNNDEVVCTEWCEPLNTVQIDEDEIFGQDVFGEDMSGPPAHPNCRCWLGHRTRIGG